MLLGRDTSGQVEQYATFSPLAAAALRCEYRLHGATEADEPRTVQ